MLSRSFQIRIEILKIFGYFLTNSVRKAIKIKEIEQMIVVFWEKNKKSFLLQEKEEEEK